MILTVQMNCVDKPVYNYLSELMQISGGGGGFSSPAPANPRVISAAALWVILAPILYVVKTVQLPE